jgi:hypothetical protein
MLVTQFMPLVASNAAPTHWGSSEGRDRSAAPLPPSTQGSRRSTPLPRSPAAGLALAPPPPSSSTTSRSPSQLGMSSSLYVLLATNCLVVNIFRATRLAKNEYIVGLRLNF